MAFDIFRAWRRLECRYKKSIGSARFSYHKSSRSRSGGGGSTRHRIKYPRQVLYLFASTFDYRLKICEEEKSSFDHQFPRLGKLLFDDSHSASEFDSNSSRKQNPKRKKVSEINISLRDDLWAEVLPWRMFASNKRKRRKNSISGEALIYGLVTASLSGANFS